MTNHVRMGIYSITQGTYEELVEQARDGLAPILRDSPGFVFYSVTDVGDGRLGRYDVPIRDEDEVAQLSHLAQVVVAPRQVEQQVPNVVEAELDPGPSQERPGGEAGARQRGR